MTQITVKQLAAAKRIAANVNPLVTRKARLQKEIEDRMKEMETLQQQIDAQQPYVKSFADGLTTEDIIVRNPTTKAYEANLEKLGWDEDKHVWFIKEEETPSSLAAEVTTEVVTEEETVGAEPTAEEIAAAEEAAREEEMARLEAEQKAAEEARQAEIRAAKERLTASKSQPAAPVEETPEVPTEVEEPQPETPFDNDPFA